VKDTLGHDIKANVGAMAKSQVKSNPPTIYRVKDTTNVETFVV